MPVRFYVRHTGLRLAGVVVTLLIAASLLSLVVVFDAMSPKVINPEEGLTHALGAPVR